MLLVQLCQDSRTQASLLAFALSSWKYWPIVAKPGDSVELAFYLALPSTTPISKNFFLDKSARYSIPVLVNEISGSQTVSDFGALKIQEFKANFSVDSTSKSLQAILTQTGRARLRYGVQIVEGNEAEDEKIVGDVLVLPANSSEVYSNAPAINISSPQQTAPRESTIPLLATMSGSGNESFRIGWFVSAGTVKNRRARTTEWTTPDTPGDHTVIVTARGMTTGAFAYSAMKIVVQ